MIDMERPITYSRKLSRWNADFAAGMAMMLGTVGKWPERTDGWISVVADIIRSKPEEDEDLPATVEEPWVAVTVRLTPAEASWLDSRGGKRKRGATMRGLLQVEMVR